MMEQIIRDALVPTGRLRVGLNLSNFLLISGQRPDGTPDGVSPDLARHIASKLDVPCEFVLFDEPGQLADAAQEDLWDIGNIAFEPDRTRLIDFSQPYVLIDANFLVHASSPFTINDDIDQTGVKIAVFQRSAYDLWLTDNLQNASLLRAASITQSHEIFYNGKADVLASLKPKLQAELKVHRGYRIIEPPFTAIKQSVGIRKSEPVVMQFLNNLITDVLNNGFITESLKKHKVDNQLRLPDGKI